MFRRITGSVAAVVLVSAACDGGAPDDSAAVEVRDSAGTRILEVGWASVPCLDVLDSVPEWTVGDGAGGGSLLLHQVRDAQILADGSLVIAEEGSQQLIRVDLSTQEVSRWGGPGDGPAEFRDIRSVVIGAVGAVGAIDHGRQRYLEFDRNGEMVAERPLGSFIQGPLLETALAPGGVIYLAAADGQPEGTGVLRASGRVVRVVGARGRGAGSSGTAGTGAGNLGQVSPGEVDSGVGPSGAGVDTLAMFYGVEAFRSPEYMGLLFFGATGLIAAGSDGVWVGDSADPEVAFWSNSSAPEHVVRWRRDLDRASESVKQGMMDAFVAAVPEQQRPLFEQQREDCLPVREELPAFGAILVGEAGTLWIGEYVGFMPGALEARHPIQEWLVIDPERARAHRVVTPLGVRVLRVGPDHLLALHRDELGVETVRQYRIEMEAEG